MGDVFEDNLVASFDVYTFVCRFEDNLVASFDVPLFALPAFVAPVLCRCSWVRDLPEQFSVLF